MFTYNGRSHTTFYTKGQDFLYIHSILNILIFLVVWCDKVSLLQKPSIDDDANARKKATSMANMDIILHGTMGNDMIFDIVSRVSILFDYFLLFPCHFASQLFFGFAIFCSFSFSFLRLKHDDSAAKLLRRPQRG